MAQTVTVDFNANLARFTSSIDKATADLNKFQSNASRVAGQIKGAFGTIGAGIGVQGLGKLADDYSNLQARLKLATRSSEEFATANEAIQRIATASKAPLLETATLYTRIASSLKDTSVSQAEMVDTTEALALSLRISGASAAEASSVMLQFSQAVASGVLRGEEFNAMAEGAPRAMQALAKSLDVSVGSLRDMAKAGQLSREVLIDGLARQLPALRKEAESLPTTFGAAFTELSNTLLLTVGQINEAAGASKTLAQSMLDLGKPAIITTFQTLGVLGANIAYVFEQAGRGIGGAAAQLAAAGRGDFKQVGAIREAMRQDFAEAEQRLIALENKIMSMGATSGSAVAKAVKDSTGDLGKTKLGGITADVDADKLQKKLDKAFDTKVLDDFLAKFSDTRNKVKAEYDKLVADLTGKTPEAGSTLGDFQVFTGTARRNLADGNAAGAQAQIDAAKGTLKALKDSGEIGWESGAYVEQLRQLEMALIDMSETTAIKSADNMRANLEAARKEIEALEPMHVPIAADAVADDLRRGFDKMRRELEDKPFQVAVELVYPQGGGSTDQAIRDAAQKRGGR